MKASSKTDTTSIKDLAYPEVEKALSNPGNISKYKKFMSGFLSKYQNLLYANAPLKQTYYTHDDQKKWFEATGIDKKIIKDGIKDTYFFKMGAFNPSYAKDESTIALLCMVRYFKKKKDAQLLNLALINIAFSGKFYPSVFYKSFRFPPAQHVMEYVINQLLNNKYDIIRHGNVIGAIKSITSTWEGAYDDRFESFTDEDCAYLVQQLHNRVDSFIHNIAVIYYQAHENKDSFITYDSDDVSEDNYHLADNDSFKINRIVENSLTELTTKPIDDITCKRSSNESVKMDELKAILENLLSDNKNIPMLREFIMLMVAIYFQQATYKSVTDISFISFSIRPTPNSKNKYVMRKKELMDMILLNNSENFQRRRNRAATESAYYRSINAYIALMIQKANK